MIGAYVICIVSILFLVSRLLENGGARAGKASGLGVQRTRGPGVFTCALYHSECVLSGVKWKGN